MGLRTAIQWGGAGFVADVAAPFLTRGLGAIGAFVAGLFQPEASDLDRAYDPAKSGATKEWSLGDINLGGLGKTALIAFGAATILPRIPFLGQMFLFSNPGFLSGIPTHPAALLPLAYSRGLIPNWGMTAGWLT